MKCSHPRLILLAVAALGCISGNAGWAQTPSVPAADREAAFLELAKTAEQVLGLVEELRNKNETLTKRVAELTDLLDMERHTTTELRKEEDNLSALLATERRSAAELRSAQEKLSALFDKERQTTVEMRAAQEKLTAQLDTEQRSTAELRAAQEKLATQLDTERRSTAEVRSAQEKLATQLDTERRATAELRLAQEKLSALLGDTQRAEGEIALKLKATQDEAVHLLRRIRDFEENAQRAQNEIESRDRKLMEIDGVRVKAEERATAERRISAETQSQVDILNVQIGALRRHMAEIESALLLSKSKDTESQTTIAELGRRLNVALAQKVEELARYRSEFFGRLRESLGDRADMRVVGDRFVFQSEVLFAPGSAELGDDARRQLDALARALKEIAGKIPTDLDWILRVDGHTDTVPIRSRDFPSNWELSTARALAVTKYLIAQGVPPMRVAAAGFGEFHPLDNRADEIGFRRNRRIEFKLTEQ